ncbi:YhjD/YihY/BrkB family envelope integrity protein [Modestobacter sp. NPDC049651]|uniref:YhjD/YihY/BrkB family envelope integrity protein n=1 Tax=unclassified Modestobacter TaxID=2643866 RepID=UPI0033EA6E79
MGVRAEVRGLAASVHARVRGRDTALIAAGLTFYAAFAVVPVLVLSLWLASLLVGDAAVRDLGADLADLLPPSLGAPLAVRRLVDAGTGMSGWQAVLALVPVSLYGEGLRRALLRYSPAPDRYTAWRGRLLALPLLVVAPFLLLVLLYAGRAVLALTDQGGVGPWLGGFLVAYYSLLGVLLLPLAWGFGVVAAGRLRRRALLVGAFITAASLSGFLQGFTLFLDLPLDLGAPFGGLTGVGSALAVAFWLWLLQFVVIAGWLFTEAVDDRLRRGSPVPAG